MPDHRGAAAVPSRARRGRFGRRTLLLGLLGGGGLLASRATVPPGAGAAAGPARRRGAPARREPAEASAVAAAPAAPSPTPRPPAPPLLATTGAVTLHVPATDAVVVAYHEASTVRSLELTPVGSVESNGNPTRFTAPPPDDAGTRYQVQVSRGRSAAPTSAVDVVLRADVPVRAPVAGVVHDVRDYALYGRHDDVRIELRPLDDPDLAVVLIHVEGPRVAVGEQVELGAVVADRARVLPFHSIVDNLTAPARHGHVHVEVKPVAALAPEPTPAPTG